MGTRYEELVESVARGVPQLSYADRKRIAHGEGEAVLERLHRNAVRAMVIVVTMQVAVVGGLAAVHWSTGVLGHWWSVLVLIGLQCLVSTWFASLGITRLRQIREDLRRAKDALAGVTDQPT